MTPLVFLRRVPVCVFSPCRLNLHHADRRVSCPHRASLLPAVRVRCSRQQEHPPQTKLPMPLISTVLSAAPTTTGSAPAAAKTAPCLASIATAAKPLSPRTPAPAMSAESAEVADTEEEAAATIAAPETGEFLVGVSRTLSLPLPYGTTAVVQDTMTKAFRVFVCKPCVDSRSEHCAREFLVSWVQLANGNYSCRKNK